jgi:phosphomannomutase/phosphoglucomutase
MLYWSIPGLSLGGGVMITGSHNPKDMNGLKLSCGTSTLYGDEIREILRMILEDDLQKGSAEGRVEKSDISGRYLEMLQSKITLGSRKLKVVADC